MKRFCVGAWSFSAFFLAHGGLHALPEPVAFAWFFGAFVMAIGAAVIGTIARRDHG